MHSALRALATYLLLLLIFRITGKRTLGQVTTFDFVLLLIISEATQQALLGEDFSITNAVVVIGTLVATDMGLSFLKQRFHRLARWAEGVPVVLVENGTPITEVMKRSRV